LDADGQEIVRSIVRDAVDLAVFGCLALLDGAAGGYPIPGKPSDFAVYLQSYADEAALSADAAQHLVRVNPNSLVDEDLHDLYTSLLTQQPKAD
jgi:hypothetical protein